MVWKHEKNKTADNCESLQKRSLLSEDLRKKPTANRRTRKPSVCSPLRVFDPRLNPALRALRIGFASPHLNSAGLIANQRFGRKAKPCLAKVVRFQRPTRLR